MEITCVFDNLLYKNTYTADTVFTIKTKGYDEWRDEKGRLVCRGKCPFYSKGMPLVLSGEFNETDGRKTFTVSDSRVCGRREFAVDFILSAGVKGVGEKTASELAAIGGDDFFAFCKQKGAAAKIEDATRLNITQAKSLVTFVKKSEIQRNIYEYIYPFGGTYENALGLYGAFGEETLDRMKKECYRVCSVGGLSFPVADAIGYALGVSPYNEDRVVGLLRCALRLGEQGGNTCATARELLERATRISDISANKGEISRVQLLITAMTHEEFRVFETSDGFLYALRGTAKNERQLAYNLRRLGESTDALKISERDIRKAEALLKIRYADAQRAAFDALKTTGIKILTGGPGTGKTTVINGMLSLYSMLCPDKKIRLCAPTGRAAQRMTEVTGCRAETIHKMLEMVPYGGDVKATYNNENRLDVDLLIVDEASMVDSELAAALLDAVRTGTTVILSGDPDQLPSVGAGNVLDDMLATGCAEVYKLDRIFRRSGACGASVTENAVRINNGDCRIRCSPEFEVVQCRDMQAVRDIIRLAAVREECASLSSFQILDATKKGPCGSAELNKLIKQIINHGGDKRRINSFTVGDKVIFMRNNYKIGYMNGDMGIVRKVDADSLIVSCSGGELEVGMDDVRDLSLAYAITIHKSQGAEYDSVMIVLPDNASGMLNRALLYTAVTRAKRRVIIVEQNNATAKAIAQERFFPRRTLLRKRLENDLEPCRIQV